MVDAEQVLAFRLARSGLAERTAGTLAEAAACPASDFVRDAALLALAARMDGVTLDAYHQAVDDGGIVVAYVVRGAIHALAPGDLALYGRSLVSRDDAELGAQLGRPVQRLAAEHGFGPVEALDEVAAATTDALAGGRALDRTQLHEELRQRVRPELMPWCRGCQSHHVAPMLWRYGTVVAGVRLDAQRRYTLATVAPGRAASEAVRRFLTFYGPATPADFAGWAGVARAHGQRLWDEVADGLTEVRGGSRPAWLLHDDAAALESPPAARGIRLLPAGDPYLQGPNRPLLAPDAALRSRLFRPVASPGAVLSDGRLAGLWRGTAKGRTLQVAVEALAPLPREELAAEAERVAAARGAERAALTVS